MISTTLKACLGVESTPSITYLGSAQYSTPVSAIPLMWEYSCIKKTKCWTTFAGVLPKKLILYTGSDLDMMYNLDILLPLDTLRVLPVLLFLVSGSTPGRLIFVSGSACYLQIKVLRVRK